MSPISSATRPEPGHARNIRELDPDELWVLWSSLEGSEHRKCTEIGLRHKLAVQSTVGSLGHCHPRSLGNPGAVNYGGVGVGRRKLSILHIIILRSLRNWPVLLTSGQKGG